MQIDETTSAAGSSRSYKLGPRRAGGPTQRPLVAISIIDPTKVVRTALQDAASVAGLAMVAEKP